VVALVARGHRFLCTAHARPDGDALGSMLATAHALRALGKEVVLYDHDPPPSRLAFLPGASEVVTSAPKSSFDATFVHDCGDRRLLGDRFPPREVTGPVVVLDHHGSTRDFGDLVVRDPSASAVGVIVARLCAALGVPLSREIAECLWCSLVSDTGWFRYSSTDLETMELAAACVRAGAEPWAFARKSEEETPVARLRLLQEVLKTLELAGEPPRRVALLTLDEAMLGRAGAGPELAEGFVNYARGLEGVEVGALLTVTRTQVRASLRGKGGVDLGAVAAAFDGGGHHNASGCTLALPFAEARKKLLEAIANAPS
ncbi:MAG TPA: bifunctional oligoribonuclease/PAP phosphatase NrnA, partial [Polyangia bacterium]